MSFHPFAFAPFCPEFDMYRSRPRWIWPFAGFSIRNDAIRSGVAAVVFGVIALMGSTTTRGNDLVAAAGSFERSVQAFNRAADPLLRGNPQDAAAVDQFNRAASNLVQACVAGVGIDRQLRYVDNRIRRLETELKLAPGRPTHYQRNWNPVMTAYQRLKDEIDLARVRVPQTGVPRVGGTGYGSPGYGNPGYGNPNYGNQGYGNPGYGGAYPGGGIGSGGIGSGGYGGGAIATPPRSVTLGYIGQLVNTGLSAFIDVTGIAPGSLADRMGLRGGDRITQINGVVPTSQSVILRALNSRTIATVDLVRGGVPIQLSAPLYAANTSVPTPGSVYGPAITPPGGPTGGYGSPYGASRVAVPNVAVPNVPGPNGPAVSTRPRLDIKVGAYTSGELIVESVGRGGLGDRMGIRVNDRIVRVGNIPVSTPEAFASVARSGDVITLIRNGQTIPMRLP